MDRSCHLRILLWTHLVEIPIWGLIKNLLLFLIEWSLQSYFSIPSYRVLIIDRCLRLSSFGLGSWILMLRVSLVRESRLFRLIIIGSCWDLHVVIIILLILLIHFLNLNVVEPWMVVRWHWSNLRFLFFLTVLWWIYAIILALRGTWIRSLRKFIPSNWLSLLISIGNRLQLLVSLRFIVWTIHNLFFLRIVRFTTATVILWRSMHILNFINRQLLRVVFKSLSLNYRRFWDRLRYRLLIIVSHIKVRTSLLRSCYRTCISSLLLKQLCLCLSELLLCVLKLLKKINLLLHCIWFSKLQCHVLLLHCINLFLHLSHPDILLILFDYELLPLLFCLDPFLW